MIEFKKVKILHSNKELSVMCRIVDEKFCHIREIWDDENNIVEELYFDAELITSKTLDALANES